MRTRSDQIEELARLFSWPHHPDDGHAQNAEDMILEAERRAEQRVRAEIGRDSERLDWLAEKILRVRDHAPYQPIIIDGNYDPGELRDAIDAARENAND